MKLKSLILTAFLGLSATTAMAQFEGKDMNDRIEYSLLKAGVAEADINDSITFIRGYISGFQDAIGKQDYKEAYTLWKTIMKEAPFALKNLYTGHAPFMFFQLIEKESEADKKMVYYNDMMSMFDLRLARLDSINSYFTDREKSSRGDVLAERADYYYWVCTSANNTNIQSKIYTFDNAYKNYAGAIKEIKENGGREVSGSTLQNFIVCSDYYFKNDNNHREQYLQDFLDSKEACEQMLQLAKEAEADGDTAKAQKLVEKYDAPLAYIEQTFAASGCAQREQLIPLYEKSIEAKKDDVSYLRSAMTLMANADCDDADIYFKAAEYAYAIEPTFESAIGLGQREAKAGNMNKMIEYYNKALELCTNDANKGKICLQIASGLRKSSQYTGALSYLDKAMNYSKDISGKALLQKANIYTQLGQYDQAVSSARSATAADITVSGQANRLISSINAAKASQAANAKAKREYDAYMAKKKAEADFWNGK